MKSGVPGGVLKPSDAPANAASSATKTEPVKAAAKAGAAEATKSAAPAKSQSSGKSITLTEKFYARKGDIYEVGGLEHLQLPHCSDWPVCWISRAPGFFPAWLADALEHA